MERDHNTIKILYQVIISTHTLTWSVTFRPERYYDLRSISTHTLTWSVTNKG